MIRHGLGGLAALLLTGSCLAAQLRVETRLEPAGATVVGETVQLYVDVLTDTWFTSAPQMPVLDIDNAVVSAPSGEARHLNLTRDGTAFFGLEFNYRITPTGAGSFVIAPMTISVTPGQASAPMTATSAPMHLNVEQPAGVPAGQSVLVARNLSLTQDLIQSRDALAIGDSVRRQITQTGDGAQMMLMTAPPFAEIDGLKSYAEPPQLRALDDGRGNISGTVRVDSVSYIVQRDGSFQLPPVKVQWWDSSARQLRNAELPAISFTASGTALRSPFSVSDDLQRLARHGRITLSRHWLAIGAWVAALVVLVYVGWPWMQRGWLWLQQRRIRRHQQWLASPRYALNSIPGQLRATPPRLDALYLWVRRQYGATGLAVLKERVPADLTRRIYGRDPHVDDALKSLNQSPALHHPHAAIRRQSPGSGLRVLNPRITETERTP